LKFPPYAPPVAHILDIGALSLYAPPAIY